MAASTTFCALACGGTPPPRAGVSTTKQGSAAKAPVAARAEVLPSWLSLASLSALPLASAEPYPVRGHFPGRYQAVVHVSQPARDAYLEPTPERALPEGSVVAQFLTERDTGSAGPVYVMRKDTENTWLFAVLAPDGTPLDVGTLPLCARCHREAPADFMFGLPRPAGT